MSLSGPRLCSSEWRCRDSESSFSVAGPVSSGVVCPLMGLATCLICIFCRLFLRGAVYILVRVRHYEDLLICAAFPHRLNSCPVLVLPQQCCVSYAALVLV